MAPAVSVLLPVRDGGGFIGEALSSLTEQTLDEFEVIVVDDGSRDDTAEVVAARAAADARIRLVRQERTGIVSALEAARGLARAPFLARMDADDVALPRRLECQVARLERGDVEACGGQVEFFPCRSVRDGMRAYEAWLNTLTSPQRAARDAYIECPIAHPTMMVRRGALAAVGGWRTRPWPEDYDLVLRLHRGGLRFCSVPVHVLRWREHEQRLSRTSGRYTQAAFVRCKVHHLRAQLIRREGTVVIYGCGPVGKSFARELQRQGVGIEAFLEVDPRKIGKRVYGVPVYAMEQSHEFPDSLAIGAVAGVRAREEIRSAAREIGRRDGVDFVAVA